VGLLEPSAQEGAAPILEFLEFEAARDLDVLQVVAAVRVKVEPLLVLFYSLAFQPLIGLRDEPLDRGL
jgi:hypothetical protein